MLALISKNIGTIVVLIILVAVIAMIIAGMRKSAKNGKKSCGCSCGDCPMAGKCHSEKEEK